MVVAVSAGRQWIAHFESLIAKPFNLLMPNGLVRLLVCSAVCVLARNRWLAVAERLVHP